MKMKEEVGTVQGSRGPDPGAVPVTHNVIWVLTQLSASVLSPESPL